MATPTIPGLQPQQQPAKKKPANNGLTNPTAPETPLAPKGPSPGQASMTPAPSGAMDVTQMPGFNPNGVASPVNPDMMATRLSGPTQAPTPAPAPLPMLGNVPGANVTQFGPDANMVGSQITPTTSDRVAGIEGQTDQARNAYQGYNLAAFNPVNPVNTNPTTTSLGNANTAQQGAKIPGYEGVGTFDPSRTNTALDAATNANANISTPFSGGADIGGFGFSGDTSRARNMTMEGLELLGSGPNRGELAADAFDLMREREEPAFQRELRQVGQRAAALGRVGSGLTTNDLTDVSTRRQDRNDLARRELANEAAGMEMQDRLNRVSAGSSVASNFGNLDRGAYDSSRAGMNDDFSRGLATAGFNRQGVQQGIDNTLSIGDRAYNVDRDMYGDQVRERDTRYGVGQDQYSAQMDKADRERRYGLDLLGVEEGRFARDASERDTALNQDRYAGDVRRQQFLDSGDEENRIRGNEAADRDELRGERGYQQGEDQRGIDNRRDQTLLEDDLLNSEFNRAAKRSELGLQAAGIPGAHRYANTLLEDSYGDWDAIDEAAVESGRRNGTATAPPVVASGPDKFGSRRRW